MFDNFLDTVKGELVNQIAGKTEVEENQLGGVADIVTDTFKSGLMDKVSSGDIGDIMSMLGKGGSSSSLAGNLINSTITNLVSKLGLPKAVANKIGNIAVPFIIDKFSDFTSAKGKSKEEGVKDIFGDLLKGSAKDSLLGGLKSKLGF